MPDLRSGDDMDLVRSFRAGVPAPDEAWLAVAFAPLRAEIDTGRSRDPKDGLGAGAAPQSGSAVVAGSPPRRRALGRVASGLAVAATVAVIAVVNGSGVVPAGRHGDAVPGSPTSAASVPSAPPAVRQAMDRAAAIAAQQPALTPAPQDYLVHTWRQLVVVDSTNPQYLADSTGAAVGTG